MQEAIGDKNKKIADLTAELNTWKSNGAAHEAKLLSVQEQLQEKNKALELKISEVSSSHSFLLNRVPLREQSRFKTLLHSAINPLPSVF